MPVHRPQIVSAFSHDSNALTQGLAYNSGVLYESTGIVGQSTVRRLGPNGNINSIVGVSDIFGEGVALVNDELVQLTWNSGLALRYRPDTLTRTGVFRYKGEGWGLCAAPGGFLMSDGSSILCFRDQKFRIRKKLTVSYGGGTFRLLNDLEYANNRIYANVWFAEFLLEIEPDTGFVTRLIDCCELIALTAPHQFEQVLNGIAFNKDNGLFYITGKQWNQMFLVDI